MMHLIKYFVNGVDILPQVDQRDPDFEKLQSGADANFLEKHFKELIRNGELLDHGFPIDSADSYIFIEKDAENEEKDDLTEVLISLVQERKPLYDFTLPLMERTKPIKDNLWREIYHQLQEKISLGELPKKWKNLRDRYLRLKGKHPSGSEAIRKPAWKYFQALTFVACCEERETSSSLQLEMTPNPSVTSCSNSPSISTGNTQQTKKKRTSDHAAESLADERFFQRMEQLSNNANRVTFDETDHFALRLAAGLKRLPRAARNKLEIDFLKQLQETELEYDV